MDLIEIQNRLDAITFAMAAKGLREPEGIFMVKSSATHCVMMSWRKRERGYDQSHHHCDSLDDAETWAAALPTPEEARMTAFLTSLDETIHLGKKADVEVDFINPLLEIFKRISKNAITDQTDGAAADAA